MRFGLLVNGMSNKRVTIFATVEAPDEVTANEAFRAKYPNIQAELSIINLSENPERKARSRRLETRDK